MALEEYVGAVVLEADGREFDCVSLSVQHSTGRRGVKTMNRSGRLSGYTEGVSAIELTVTVVIPKDGDEPQWAQLKNAKITRELISGGGRFSYLDCFTTAVGTTFEVDGEARKTINMMASREVKE